MRGPRVINYIQGDGDFLKRGCMVMVEWVERTGSDTLAG